MMRVWLSDWEWRCCGTPFGLGDRVEFATTSSVDAWVARMLGADLAGTIDAVESHHEEPGPVPVVGRVAAIHAVTIEMRNRRVRRDARRPAPMTSKLTLTLDDPDAPPVRWAAGTPSEWYVEGVQVPATGRLRAVDGVPSPSRRGSPRRAEQVAAAMRGEGPEEWSDRSVMGWVVDVETSPSGAG